MRTRKESVCFLSLILDDITRYSPGRYVSDISKSRLILPGPGPALTNIKEDFREAGIDYDDTWEIAEQKVGLLVRLWLLPEPITQIGGGEISVSVIYSSLYEILNGLDNVDERSISIGRNVQGSQSIYRARPDLNIDLYNYTIIRGEDKEGAGQLVQAVRELSEKMKPEWTDTVYGPVRFVLGIACAGPLFQVQELRPSNGAIVSEKIFDGDIRKHCDRAKLLVLMVKTVRHHLSNLEHFKNVPTLPTKRPNHLSNSTANIIWRQGTVQNQFEELPNDLVVFKEHFRHGFDPEQLVKFYQATRHVVGLEHGQKVGLPVTRSRAAAGSAGSGGTSSMTSAGSSRGYLFATKPLCERRGPRGLKESLECFVAMGKVISALGACGWAHLDPRMTNILPCAPSDGGQVQWTLVDSEFARPIDFKVTKWEDLPTGAQQDAASKTTWESATPDNPVNNHLLDIFMLGGLVSRSPHNCNNDDGRRLQIDDGKIIKLARQMQEGEVSARIAALKELVTVTSVRDNGTAVFEAAPNA